MNDEGTLQMRLALPFWIAAKMGADDHHFRKILRLLPNSRGDRLFLEIELNGRIMAPDLLQMLVNVLEEQGR